MVGDNWDVSQVKSMWDIGPNYTVDHIPRRFWTQTTRNSATRRSRILPFLLFNIIVEHYCLCQLNVKVFLWSSFCLVWLCMQHRSCSGVKNLNSQSRHIWHAITSPYIYIEMNEATVSTITITTCPLFIVLGLLRETVIELLGSWNTTQMHVDPNPALVQ